MQPAISVTNVSKTFGQKVRAVGIDALHVEAGDFVALLGPSGSGKSTLIRLISGLERADSSSKGQISVLGVTTQKGGKRLSGGRQVRGRIGIIFQQFNLVGRLSLLTNVLIGRLGQIGFWRGCFGLFTARDKVLAAEALQRVGILEKARQRASTLSGGQQQRGAIARALTQQAEIILADEPIASLDPAAADQVMETLAQINRESGVTVVVSLHQVEHALKHCRRVVALKNGDVIYDGETASLSPEFFADLYGSADLVGISGVGKPQPRPAAQPAELPNPIPVAAAG